MIEKNNYITFFSYLILSVGVFLLFFPLYSALIVSTKTQSEVFSGNISLYPGTQFIENYSQVLFEGFGSETGIPIWKMLKNSFIMAMVISLGKIFISYLAAFAIIYFRFPLRNLCFIMIFMTLMLPVEVRIIPTFEVIANLELLNSFFGLTVPLIASATATFLFRQFFLTIPDELLEAAKVDGSTPFKFLKDILLPLSTVNITALFVIMFIFGWNQYLWPLLVTTDENFYTIVMGIQRIVRAANEEPNWHLVMAVAVLAILPPMAVIVFMQKYFVKGLIDTDK